jgi:hypothetical protein
VGRLVLDVGANNFTVACMPIFFQLPESLGRSTRWLSEAPRKVAAITARKKRKPSAAQLPPSVLLGKHIGIPRCNAGTDRFSGRGRSTIASQTHPFFHPARAPGSSSVPFGVRANAGSAAFGACPES